MNLPHKIADKLLDHLEDFFMAVMVATYCLSPNKDKWHREDKESED